VDLSLQVSIRWSAVQLDNGAFVERFSGQKSENTGRQINVAPYTFSAGTTFVVTAVAYVQNVAVSSASLQITSYNPTTNVTLIGGYARVVSGAATFTVAAFPKPAPTANDAVSWACCEGKQITFCLIACPSPLSTAVAAAKGSAVIVPAGVPQGEYTITAYYKGTQASQSLTVTTSLVPQVLIVQPRQLPQSTQLTFYAAAEFDDTTTLPRWHYNGAYTSAGQTFTAFQANTTSAFTLEAVICSALNVTRCGSAVIQYAWQTAVSGSCTVTASDGTLTNRWQALSTPLTLKSMWTSGAVSLRFNFVMTYVDPVHGKTHQVILAPYDSTLSEFDFVVPLIRSNPASAEVQFAVHASDADTSTLIATAACAPVTIRAANITATSTFVDTQLSTLRAAQSVNDMRSIYDTTATIAAALGNLSESDRNAPASEVVAVIQDLMNSSGNIPNRASRTSALHVVSALTAAGVLTSLNATTKARVSDTLLNLLNATGSQNSLDTDREGSTVIDILAAVRNATYIAPALEQLSLQMAVQSGYGVQTTLTALNISAAAVSWPGGTPPLALSTPSGSITLPSDAFRTTAAAGAADASAIVSLAASTLADDPTAPADLVIDTTVAEFHVLINGARIDVPHVPSGIVLRLKIAAGVANASELMCLYYDRLAHNWTSTGVATIGYDSTRGELICNATHLSMFGGSVGPRPSPSVSPQPTLATLSPTGPPSSTEPVPAAAPAGDPPSRATVSIIVGCSVAALFMVFIFTFAAIRKLRTAADVVGQPLPPNTLQMPTFSQTNSIGPRSNSNMLSEEMVAIRRNQYAAHQPAGRPPLPMQSSSDHSGSYRVRLADPLAPAAYGQARAYAQPQLHPVTPPTDSNSMSMMSDDARYDGPILRPPRSRPPRPTIHEL
jgi:hypothetical protein